MDHDGASWEKCVESYFDQGRIFSTLEPGRLRLGQQDKPGLRTRKGGAHHSRMELGRKGGLTHMRSLSLHPSSGGLRLCKGWDPGRGCGLRVCTRTEARVRSGLAVAPGWRALVSGSV